MYTDDEIQVITANVETEIVDELIENFLNRKKDSLLLSDSFRRLGMIEKSHRVRECGSWLQYRVHLDKLNDPRCQRLTGANFCGYALCSSCAWRRSRKLKSQLLAITEHLIEYRFLFLTLTVRNVYADELLTATDLILSKAWHRFTNYKKFKNAIKGYFRSFEITHDTDLIITHSMYKRKHKYYKRCGLNIGDANPTYGTYHPHAHILLAVEPSYFDKSNDIYISQAEWRKMWAAALGVDYDPFVDIRAVYDKRAGNSRRKRDIDTVTAILEVGKYISKSNDYIIRGADKSVDEVQTDSAVKAISTSLAGRRTVSYGGVFRQAKKDLQLNDDENLVHTEIDANHITSNYISYECSWVGRRKGSSGGYKINSEYNSSEERGDFCESEDVDD